MLFLKSLPRDFCAEKRGLKFIFGLPLGPSTGEEK